MSRSPFADRRGLTLLELIVALGILAVLSTVAVQALDPLADQARYETTQRTLDQLRVATVGDPLARQVDGQRVVSGYVADMGQLPGTLDDLFTQPVGMIASSVQSFDSDRDSVNDVTLTSGWKGPYLQLGAGISSLTDGWGRAPLVDPDAGDFDFTSYGSDDDSVSPEDGYRADVSVVIPASHYTTTATFRLFAIDAVTSTRIDPSPSGTQQLGVLLYGIGVAGGSTGAIEELMIPVAATGTFEATQSSFVQGHAAARGILWDDADSDDVLDAGETIVDASYVHYFTVTSETDLRIEMELR
ncbi:MAG: prepilin-type N-terminal cleavage/methylation domain-containing protein [Planctomycetota bacterium]